MVTRTQQARLLRYWVRQYQPWFAIGRAQVRGVYDTTAPYHGITFDGPLAATILINLSFADTEDRLRGTVLHEFIHAEQLHMGRPTDHGAYFQNRRRELQERTGLPI